jgi:hypothetical protein
VPATRGSAATSRTEASVVQFSGLICELRLKTMAHQDALCGISQFGIFRNAARRELPEVATPRHSGSECELRHGLAFPAES